MNATSVQKCPKKASVTFYNGYLLGELALTALTGLMLGLAAKSRGQAPRTTLAGFPALGLTLCCVASLPCAVEAAVKFVESGTEATVRALAVDILAVANTDDVDCLVGGIEVVDDPKVSDSQRVAAAFLAFQELPGIGVLRE